MRQLLWTASLLLGIPSASAAAQTPAVSPDTSQHVLEVPAPAQPLLCREVTEVSDALPPRDATMWKFEVGAPPPGPVPVRPRQIVAAFDSAGTPLLLIDMVTYVPIRSDQVALRFISGGEAVGHWRWVRFDSAAVARMEAAVRSGGGKQLQDAIPPAQVRNLTLEEQSRARLLAEWIWKHHCRRRSAT